MRIINKLTKKKLFSYVKLGGPYFTPYSIFTPFLSFTKRGIFYFRNGLNKKRLNTFVTLRLKKKNTFFLTELVKDTLLYRS